MNAQRFVRSRMYSPSGGRTFRGRSPYCFARASRSADVVLGTIGGGGCFASPLAEGAPGATASVVGVLTVGEIPVWSGALPATFRPFDPSRSRTLAG
jgi:hypothetical protein